jgi:endonuclease/exonuclease/phosphatase family metal-dependent hydrolase
MKDIARFAPVFLLIAACATPLPPKPASVELTVLTWNILHGASDEGELNLEAKASYISEQGADLVHLQEISRGWMPPSERSCLSRAGATVWGHSVVCQF